MEKCPICKRELGVVIDRHHLIPKTFGGKEQITLHKICHRKLHSAITEKEMEKWYNTIERILEHEEITRFVKWVARKDIDYYSGSDETVVRKGKRR